jgi:hypothetical protein
MTSKSTIAKEQKRLEIIPCIWDNRQKCYIPVNSYRGKEICKLFEAKEKGISK